MAIPLQAGELYSKGKSIEMQIHAAVGKDARVQAKGTGSCKIVGKLTPNAEYKPFALKRMSDLTIVEEIEDDEIYAVDLTGVHTVTVQDVTGFTSVWINVMK